MEASDLATFAAVARCGGITRAAKELHTVQSNVTNRIKALEDEVGVPLFERHSRGVVLTPAGTRLLPYAARAAALLQEALACARDDGEARGPLAIGSMETSMAVRLPAVLAAFHARHPAVALTVRTGPTAELIQKVLDSEVDGAFVAGPVDHPGLRADKAFDEELVLVTSHRWPDLAALRQATVPLTALMFRAGCSYRQRLEQLLVQLGRPFYKRLEFGTLDGMLACVAADVGLTLLPRHVAERAPLPGRLVLHAVDASIAHSPTLFVQRRDAHASTALRMFRACLADPALRPPSAFPVSALFEPVAA